MHSFNLRLALIYVLFPAYFPDLLRGVSPFARITLLSGTRKRRLRRQRAAARTAWYLHRTGRVLLDLPALQRIKRTLSSHHSKDRNFIRKIQLQIDMDPELFPWRFSACQRINKKTATRCAICQAHWSSGTRHRTEPHSQSYQMNWSQDRDYDWNAWESEEKILGPSNAFRSERGITAFRKIIHQLSFSRFSKSPWPKRQGQRQEQGQEKGQRQRHRGWEVRCWRQCFQAACYRTYALAICRSFWAHYCNFCYRGSFECSDTFGPPPAEERVCCSSPGGLPRGIHYPTGDTRTHRQNGQRDRKAGERNQQIRDQEHTYRHQGPRTCSKDTHRNTGSAEGASHEVGQACDRGGDHMARSAQGVQETTGGFQRGCIEKPSLGHRKTPETAIQTLSSKAPHEALATLPNIATVSAEQEESTMEPDQEEEKLQSQLQQVLVNCARSAGQRTVSRACRCGGARSDHGKRHRRPGAQGQEGPDH